jgi:hypothetical protein
MLIFTLFRDQPWLNVERKQLGVQQQDVLQGELTVLLGVTMDGDKLPLYIIYKGAKMHRSQIKKEFKDVEARAKYDYHQGQFYVYCMSQHIALSPTFLYIL